MNVGIVCYGVYVPIYRIKAEEIAKAWQQNFNQIQSSLSIEEKSVPGIDEDSVTFAVNAAKNALLQCNLGSENINAIYVGSESAPYAVKPTATIVGQAIGANTFSMAADMEFACKAGTAALGVCLGLVKSGFAKFGMAIGTDTAQAAPGDILEYSAGAGAAALIVGPNVPSADLSGSGSVGIDATGLIAVLEDTISIASDTPDFWRRSLQKYPEHAGRFTAEPAYLKHICAVVEKLFAKHSYNAASFDYVVFHQPNGKLPLIAAKTLGFSHAQVAPGLIAPQIGNTYSANALLGLCSVLDQAEPDKRILLVSYGSGSGCDAFIFKTTQNIKKVSNFSNNLKSYLSHKKYLTYSEYRRNIESF
jgi:hydroxymethylglutaryl-CoA synthase